MDNTIVICGDSASGKTTLQNYLVGNLGYEKIISYTTRSPREGEKNGKDYWFISNDEFKSLILNGFFAEYEEYSQDRFYGTSKESYKNGNKVVVLTPNGIRSVNKVFNTNNNIITAYVKTSLGNRIIRYINRIGIENFNFDDKNEICARVERDFGMFLGIEDNVDIVIDGDKELEDMTSVIRDEVVKRVMRYEDSKWS